VDAHRAPDRYLVTVPDERWRDLWPPGEEPVDVRVWDMTGEARVDPVLVVLPYMGASSVLFRLAELPSLRVVQTLSAGYDDVLPSVPDGVTLATAAGVHDASTAELAVGLAVAQLRGIDEFARAAPEGRWLSGRRPALADRRVLLVGTGSVGSAVGARLAPFEVEVTRVGTRPRDDDRGHVYGVDELHELLPRHEVVVLTVPLTDRTRGMADAAFLAAMPDGALLVNVSRGPVVVTDALLAELESGRLRAGLDVTDPEPLPADHPLIALPNAIVVPHIASASVATRDEMARLAARNLLAVLQGERPPAIVNPEVLDRR
jgi:phosphoglycerate dehydrogenase-like enzyme